MKTFEEQFTAWVDGRLEGAELAAFERELESHPELLPEEEFAPLGHLLRSHVAPAPLRNADFFNHQLMQEIEKNSPAPIPHSTFRTPHSFWSLQRMAFSGAFLLLLSTVLYFAAVPNTRREVRRNQQYVKNELNAISDDPGITATSFHSKENNVNVLWLEGLTPVPRSHKLKR